MFVEFRGFFFSFWKIVNLVDFWYLEIQDSSAIEYPQESKNFELTTNQL